MDEDDELVSNVEPISLVEPTALDLEQSRSLDEVRRGARRGPAVSFVVRWTDATDAMR